MIPEKSARYIAVKFSLRVIDVPTAAPPTRASESTPKSQIAFLLHFPFLMRKATRFKPSLKAWTRSAAKTAKPRASLTVNAIARARPSMKM